MAYIKIYPILEFICILRIFQKRDNSTIGIIKRNTRIFRGRRCSRYSQSEKVKSSAFVLSISPATMDFATAKLPLYGDSVVLFKTQTGIFQKMSSHSVYEKSHKFKNLPNSPMFRFKKTIFSDCDSLLNSFFVISLLHINLPIRPLYFKEKYFHSKYRGVTFALYTI